MIYYILYYTIQNTEYRIQNTEYRIQNTEYRIQNMTVKTNVILINNKYLLGSLIGSGSFGNIYMGIDKDKNPDEDNRLVAIKLESMKTSTFQLLGFESKIYNYISKSSVNDASNVPKIFWYGQQNDYNVLIMELLGPTLEFLVKKSTQNGKFSIKTTCLIAQDIIQGISYIHSRGIIHRDIKPENFLIGYNNNKIHIIDFGLSKVYYDINTKKHNEFKHNSKLIGTIRYCSSHSHKGFELSRRDDLESIGYVLIYLIKGSLPWQGMQKKKEDKEDVIGKLKEKIPNSELCSGLPNQFVKYFDHVKNLGFDDKPDYSYLYGLFIDIYKKYKYEYDNVYDWS